jgi:hypothetical protein
MNERIREFAEQAGYTPLPGFDFANELQEVFLAKFAELIVQECCDIVRQCRFAPDEDAIVNEIVHHFGVEE